MALSLHTHTIGDIAVIDCNGRIVEGAESAALYQQVRDLLATHRFFVLDLRKVSFVDSSGLGLLVRLLSRVRGMAGDLKLCGVGPNIEKTLTLTRLGAVLGSYATDADAIAALYQKERGNDLPLRPAVDIIAIHSSHDVLTYIRELLHQAGYAVMTTDTVPNALTLIRATEPRVVVIEQALRSRMTGAMPDIFTQFVENAQVIDLPPSFSTDDAGEAGARLLEQMKQRTAVDAARD
ncbi:MAG TPA: STAS domain-containing protein [Vicinamibacterales bacterium]